MGNTSDGVFLSDVGSNTITRNYIAGNKGNGVTVFGTHSTSNTVSGNAIGFVITPPGATVNVPNSANGVYLNDAGNGTSKGANLIGPGNTISGNSQSGVMIFGTQHNGGYNSVEGNFIGTTESGTQAIPNGGNGVFIYGTSNNSIGGSLGGTQNVISGNAQSGVLIFSPNSGAPADSNLVQGNLIGTDWSGSVAVPNHADGVQMINSNSNTIGGTGGNARNVISGNLASGVEIDVLTSKNTNIGLTASNNVVTGNYIGTSATGNAALLDSTQQYGVLVSNATNNTIGATGGATISGTNAPATPENVISGNGLAGIDFTGSSSSGNSVLGNYIGVAFNGAAAAGLGNPTGILLDNTGVNTIGGSDQAAGNVITQSSLVSSAATTAPLVGVSIIGPPGASTGSTVFGNLIGLDGSGAPASQAIGVLITNSTGNVIGGTVSGGRNVISGNLSAGISITGQTSAFNRVQSNLIGTDTSGNMLIYNGGAIKSDDLGNIISQKEKQFPNDPNSYLVTPSQYNGVLINQASNNVVGPGNLISGNKIGVNIEGAAGDSTKGGSNVVAGNSIGIGANANTAVPNFEYGVYISGSPNNSIGGNVISANGVAGIDIFGGGPRNSTVVASLGNVISGNLIGTNTVGGLAFPSGPTTNMTAHPVIIIPSPDDPAQPNTVSADLPAYLGLQLNGVVVIGSAGNFIGGSTKADGNFISGNILTGVFLTSHDFLGNTYAQPFGNTVQNNQIVREGMYGVYLYDAPEAANQIVLTGPPANTITGSPISVGTYVTGVSSLVPAQPNPQSILLPPPYGVPVNPFSQPAAGGSGTGTKKVTSGGKHKPPPKVHHRLPKTTKHTVTRPARNTPHGASTKATAVNRVVSRPKVPVLVRLGAKSVLVRHPAIKTGK